MRLRGGALAMAASVVLLAATVAARSPAVQEGPDAPRRIVSLIPAVTEMLAALGAGPLIVGIGSFDRLPDGMSEVPRVGGLIDPDVERILSLRPDLVMVYATQSDLRQQLERAGVPMFLYEHAGLEDVTLTLRQIGARLGLADRAGVVVDGIRRHLAATHRRVRGRAPPRTLVVFNREPGTLRGVYASGGVGFLHDMLELAGGRNVLADVPRQAVQLSTELLIAAAPDVVLELRTGATTLDPEERSAEREVWNALPSLPAVRAGRVFVLDGREIVVPGPGVARGTEALARLLHPGAFAEAGVDSAGDGRARGPE